MALMIYPSKNKRLMPVKQIEQVVDENDITSLAENLKIKDSLHFPNEFGQLTLDFCTYDSGRKRC